MVELIVYANTVAIVIDVAHVMLHPDISNCTRYGQP